MHSIFFGAGLRLCACFYKSCFLPVGDRRIGRFAKAEKPQRNIRKILGRIGYMINKREKNKNLQIARIYNFFSARPQKSTIYGGLQKQICAIAQRTRVLYFYKSKITVREREELQKTMPKASLNVQCFVEKKVKSIFEGENQPKLLYVSEIRPDVSAHPRVMHAHEDFVELILICSGSSEYLIHDKKVIIKPGDLLVYNAGVVHDEVSGPNMEVGSYCIAVGGLHMPGLRENALIPDDAGYVFPTGKYFADLRCLFEMMFRTLSAGEPNAELFCSSLMHALLVSVLTVTAGPHAESEKSLEEPHILGRRIKEYIDKHYMEPITLQSMGEALHISPYYLSHVFKQMSGYSPVQYLLRRRIGEAQTLLITTDLSITRIAEMVGYDTQSYFNLQFTKNVGMPPNKFRQNYIVSTGIEEKPKRKRK